ncbi:MAG: hypothetical protein EZS28_032158 [Streblomastix strix]|uniref:KilA-N domain-containing protein n=1 Tax=Streblomastix strix TaxID=222440 RepID=A0A5J4UNL0_9EUKA|nr:MAG: hypothetical protein EZS28_032158 [Streblomastix strix]
MELNLKYSTDFRGYYIHPKLINYIAIWASPQFASSVGEIMDVINERIQVAYKEAYQQDDQISIVDIAKEQIQMVIEEQKVIINQKDDEIKQLKPRAVPDGYQTDYIFAVQVEDDDKNDNAVLNIRRRNKYCTSKKLMRELKDSLLFYEKIPISMSKNYEIKDQLFEMFGDQIKFHKCRYIFNPELMDDVIDFIKHKMEHK